MTRKRKWPATSATGRRPAGFTRPRRLEPHDLVAVVAPAGPFDRGTFEAGLRILAERYRPVFDEGLFARTRYLAGDDARRLDELTAALADNAVKAVFCARGGYGSMRLLSKLRVAHLTPKPVIGFSDITALHLALQAAGWVSIHGPVVTQLPTQPRHVIDRLCDLLESAAAPPPPLQGSPMVGGAAEGVLVGGNLSVMTRLLGTAHLPALDGVVLLLEDVDERPYRLDRMWSHLALAGAFDRVRGIVLGEFAGCEDPAEEYTSTDVLRTLAREVGLPCAGGFAIGHGAVNLPVPLGCRVLLDGDAGTLTFREPAVVEPDAS